MNEEREKVVFDLESMRTQGFIIEQLDGFASKFKNEQADQSHPVKIISKNGMSSQISLTAIHQLIQQREEDRKKENFETVKPITYKIKLRQKIVSKTFLKEFDYNLLNVYSPRKQYYLLSISGEFIKDVYPIADSPGAYILIDTETLEFVIVKYEAAAYQRLILDSLEFYQFYPIAQILNFNPTQINRQAQNLRNLLFGQIDTKVNILFCVSGALYESLALYQINQLLSYFPQENYRFLFFETIFLSPDIKQHLRKLQSLHSQRFEVEFINYPWPKEVMYQDFQLTTIMEYKRVMLFEHYMPHYIHRFIQKDADQCHSNRSDFRQLQDIDIKDFPLGIVEHCSFFNGSGYDHFKYLKRFKAAVGSKYYVLNLFTVNLQAFRQKKFSDFTIQVYNKAVKDNGFDPFNLNQDFVNVNQMSVPIFQLPDEWSWAEAFCDPDKKQEARVIDFQDANRENKISIAKRVCENFEAEFNQVIQLLSDNGSQQNFQLEFQENKQEGVEIEDSQSVVNQEEL